MTKKVTIVGVGALGSNLALALRAEDIQLKVIDFDRIEAKNTLVQFHAKGSIGKNKADALKALMQLGWGAKVEAVPQKLTVANVIQLLDGADLVIDCLDNGEGRRLIQGHVRHNNEKPAKPRIELLHGALAANGAYGCVLWDENFTIDDAEPGAATCEGGEHGPFILTAVGFLAYAAQRWLREGKKVGYHVYPSGATKV